MPRQMSLLIVISVDRTDDEQECAAGASTDMSSEVADNNQVLQLTIHRTDKLKSNLYIAHPVVRVHIVNLDTGSCLKKQKRCVALVLSVS